MIFTEAKFRHSGEMRDVRHAKPEQMFKLMESISKEINEELGDYNPDSKDKMLDEDCAINPMSFKVSSGGPYKKENIKKDIKFVKERDTQWSGFGIDETKNANVMDHFKRKFGAKNQEEAVFASKQEKKKSKGSLWEMAVTAMFYKIVGDEFLVMRSSTYDDYKNGVDNLIVHKETGDVICALDELHENIESNRREEKEKKILKKNHRGGASIKYGITFEPDKQGQNQLVRTEMKNIPVFCISVVQDNLEKLLDEMNYNVGEKPSQTELQIFKQVNEALIKQVESLSEDTGVRGGVKENLDKFHKHLSRMKELGEK